MSRDNILAQYDFPYLGTFVVFQARRGTVVYGFTSSEGSAIQSGADPQQMSGVLIQSVADVLQMAGRNVPEVIIEQAMEAIGAFL